MLLSICFLLEHDKWDILKKSPEFSDVFDLMKEHPSHLEDFSRELSIPANVRSNVRDDPDFNAKLEKILRYWIDYEPSDVTWRQVFKVLEKLTMKGVARKVQRFIQKEDVRSKYVMIEDFTPYQYTSKAK